MSTTQQVKDQPNMVASNPSLELKEDQIYHLLQNERRRNILRYLHNLDGQVAMRDLAEQVAAWENDTTVQALSSSERQRIYIPLYQSHLPKLDEEGIIEYDQSRGTVRKTSAADMLYNYLEPAETEVDDESDGENEHLRWVYHYLGTSGVGTMLLVGTILGVTPFTLVPQGMVDVLILGMFCMLTFYHQLA